ncbi:MAG: ribonuclease III [Clostridiales Family XIII bacterium]|jgi:ribonuclease-3 family protein|nr:ribonuclease III [Clostridiales Family XIII bacterium]
MNTVSGGMNTTVLAYLGDAVYELHIRRYVIATGQIHADRLHTAAVRYVRAGAQAAVIREIFDELSAEEQALVKRARNKKSASKPKNADPVEYKWATAFEALLGYYALSGKTETIESIISRAIKIIDQDERSAAHRIQVKPSNAAGETNE